MKSVCLIDFISTRMVSGPKKAIGLWRDYVMKGRSLYCAVMVLLFLGAVHAFAPQCTADPPAKDQQKKGEEKDKKSGVKKSDTVPAGSVVGTIVDLDVGAFSLEAIVGVQKQRAELLIADDVKIRIPRQLEFDEKGKAKPFKPDPNDPDRGLGGVKGTFADLRKAQTARVTLGRLPNKKLVATVIAVIAEPKK